MKSAVMLKSVLLLVMAISVVSTGCKKKPKANGGAGFDEMGNVIGQDMGDGGLYGYGDAMNPDGMAAAASQFETLYFDYDSSIVSPSERGKLDAIVEFLRANPQSSLVVEGHCDERGSNEYNLALGERRAQSVRAYLLGMGVEPGRVTTKSYGEENPAALGHDEGAWRLNRRAQFSLY
ncbi:MAG: OmpA family protein [Kiritimatiellae bacterium]|nr:OmpA family protein [Kiritimatiellia bacterium]